MRDARWYTRADDGSVRCGLCSHRCAIRPGARGICGVRENTGGALQSLGYGALVARAIDPIEKKPLYHFLPGSSSYSIAAAGCNLRCEFCQNWQISQSRTGAMRQAADASPQDVAADALDTGCASVAYTYTEPTVVLEFVLDTAAEAHARGIANVLVTNGYQTPEAVDAMAGLIDAANVDLKAFSDEFYRTHCGASLEPVLDSIRRMHGAGIHVELTTLVIPGWNDDEVELRSLAEFIAGMSTDIAWHVSRFHPDYKAMDRDVTPEETLERALAIGRAAGLRYVYAGNATVGSSDTACPACGARLVARRGYHTTIDRLAPVGGASGPRCGAVCAACGAGVPFTVLAAKRSG